MWSSRFEFKDYSENSPKSLSLKCWVCVQECYNFTLTCVWHTFFILEPLFICFSSWLFQVHMFSFSFPFLLNMLLSLFFHTCFILAFVHMFYILLQWGLLVYKSVVYSSWSSVCSLLRISNLLGLYSEHWLDTWDKLSGEFSSCL